MREPEPLTGEELELIRADYDKRLKGTYQSWPVHSIPQLFATIDAQAEQIRQLTAQVDMYDRDNKDLRECNDEAIQARDEARQEAERLAAALGRMTERAEKAEGERSDAEAERDHFKEELSRCYQRHESGMRRESARAEQMLRENKSLRDALENAARLQPSPPVIITGDLQKAVKECDAARAEVERLRAFVRNVSRNFDCDTGANGCHSDHCRCCEAEGLLRDEKGGND